MQAKQRLLCALDSLLRHGAAGAPKPDDEDDDSFVVLGDGEVDGVSSSSPCDDEREVEAILSARPVVDVARLRAAAFQRGLPLRLRAQGWALLCGLLPPRADEWPAATELAHARYAELAAGYDLRHAQQTWADAAQRTLYNDIRVDLPRTLLPGFGMFCGQKEVQYVLGRVLFLWAESSSSAESYFQGQMDLAYLLFIAFLSAHPAIAGDLRALARVKLSMLPREFVAAAEADTFGCLSRLMDKLAVAFTRDFTAGVDAMLDEMSRVVAVGDPAMWNSLLAKDCRLPDFGFRWMVCLLVREFRVPRAMRLWDGYFALWEHNFTQFHVFVCAALVLSFGEQVQRLDFFDLVNFMQHLPLDLWTDSDIFKLFVRTRNLLAMDVTKGRPFAQDPAVASAAALAAPPTLKGHARAASGTLLQRRASGGLHSTLAETLKDFLRHVKLPGGKQLSMDSAVAVLVYAIVAATTLLVLLAFALSLARHKVN